MRTTKIENQGTITTDVTRDDHGHVWLIRRDPAKRGVQRVRVTGTAWAERVCPARTPEEA